MTRYLLYKRQGGGPRDCLDGCEKNAPSPTGIRSPDRLACSKSVYRVLSRTVWHVVSLYTECYPGPLRTFCTRFNTLRSWPNDCTHFYVPKLAHNYKLSLNINSPTSSSVKSPFLWRCQYFVQRTCNINTPKFNIHNLNIYIYIYI